MMMTLTEMVKPLEAIVANNQFLHLPTGRIRITLFKLTAPVVSGLTAAFSRLHVSALSIDALWDSLQDGSLVLSRSWRV